MSPELSSLSASPSGSSSSTFPSISTSFAFFSATKALWMRKLERKWWKPLSYARWSHGPFPIDGMWNFKVPDDHMIKHVHTSKSWRRRMWLFWQIYFTISKGAQFREEADQEDLIVVCWTVPQENKRCEYSFIIYHIFSDIPSEPCVWKKKMVYLFGLWPCLPLIESQSCLIATKLRIQTL